MKRLCHSPWHYPFPYSLHFLILILVLPWYVFLHSFNFIYVPILTVYFLQNTELGFALFFYLIICFSMVVFCPFIFGIIFPMVWFSLPSCYLFCICVVSLFFHFFFSFSFVLIKVILAFNIIALLNFNYILCYF